MTTKERILNEALNLFSIKGYSSVSVRDIAYGIGIKESSLYNHYSNKQDIFNYLIIFCKEIVATQYGNLNLKNLISLNHINSKQLLTDTLHSISITIYNLYTTNEHLRMFRQILTIEQYNNIELSRLYKEVFIDQAILYQTTLFSYLMDIGVITKGQPKALALEFYSPIFLLLCRYDSLDDEASRLLKIHIDHFIQKNTTI